jgi:hypothetical protein
VTPSERAMPPCDPISQLVRSSSREPATSGPGSRARDLGSFVALPSFDRGVRGTSPPRCLPFIIDHTVGAEFQRDSFRLRHGMHDEPRFSVSVERTLSP